MELHLRQSSSFVPNRPLLFCVLLLFITIVTHVLFAIFPALAEHVYGQGIWPVVQTVFSTFIVPLPFNIFYLYIGLIVLWIGWLIWYSIEHSSIQFPLRQLFFLISGFYIFFQWCWGFNYQRPVLNERMKWQSAPISTDSVKTDFIQWTEVLEHQRQILESKMDASEDYPTAISSWKASLNRTLRQKILPSLKYRANASLNVRALKPEGALLRMGTAGFYFPFSGEGQIDKGLHALQKPFTTAHEMAHAAGVTGEGDCNFIGALACLNADDLFIRYSGQLAVWRYFASEVRRTHPQWYDSFYEHLHPLILKDIEAIRSQMRKFPDFMPEFRNRMYDTYLRAQGVEGGMANYGQVVRLMHKTLRDRPDLLRSD